MPRSIVLCVLLCTMWTVGSPDAAAQDSEPQPVVVADPVAATEEVTTTEVASDSGPLCEPVARAERGPTTRPVPDSLFSVVGGFEIEGAYRAIRLSRSTVELFESGVKVREIQRAEIESFDLVEIARLVDDPDWIVEREPTIWELRAAIVQSRGTLLRITSPLVTELRLIDEPGVMLIGSGADMAIARTRVTSWDPVTESVDRDLDDNRPFIYFKDASRVDIVDSEIVGLGSNRSLSYGVSLRRGATGTITGSLFIDNYIGFHASEAEGIVVENNLFESSHLHGIAPSDRSGNLQIRNNIVRCNGEHGIIVSGGVSDLQIEGNEVTDNGGNGIMVDAGSREIVVSGNTVHASRGDGIVVNGSVSTTITMNDVANSGVGIRLKGADTDIIQVDQNKAHNNNVGVEAEAGIGQLTLTNNTLSDNTTTGLLLQSQDVEVTGGRIDGSPRAIDVRGSANFHDLEVEASETAVMVRAGASVIQSSNIVSAERGVVTTGPGTVRLVDSSVRAARPVSGAVELQSTSISRRSRSQTQSLMLAPVVIGMVVGCAYALARLHGRVRVQPAR